MKNPWWIQNPKARFCVAMGAGLGFGQMVFHVLTKNIGPIPGMLGGAAAIAILILGFYLILTATAGGSDSAQDG